MNNATKNGQLRVRMDEASLRKLVDIGASRPNRGNLSDLVREAIAGFIDQKGSSALGSITPACHDRILEFAAEAQRPPSQIVEECVEGIHRLLNSEETPLIVMELRLRRKYFERRKQRSSEPDCELISRSLELLPEGTQ
jgi:hypothetical protein